MIEVRHYVSRAGKDVFDDWLTQLADAAHRRRLQPGSTGWPPGTLATASHCGKVCSSCGSIGGPGYRVYYAMIGRECVLLLCGGDKRKQAADIERALEYLKDYRERSGTS